MILHHEGLVEYQDAMAKMQSIHNQAIQDRQNHLIVCSHPKVFTVGVDDTKEWSVPTIRTSRGGSITAHSKGQVVLYFCFVVNSPVEFYKKIIRVYKSFFASVLPQVSYNPKQAGFYINSRKVASLGFRYSRGVSMHGVALNVDVDLHFHNLVAPCGLEGIEATSLKNEGIEISQKEVEQKLISLVEDIFDDSIQT